MSRFSNHQPITNHLRCLPTHPRPLFWHWINLLLIQSHCFSISIFHFLPFPFPYTFPGSSKPRPKPNPVLGSFLFQLLPKENVIIFSPWPPAGSPPCPPPIGWIGMCIGRFLSVTVNSMRYGIVYPGLLALLPHLFGLGSTLPIIHLPTDDRRTISTLLHSHTPPVTRAVSCVCLVLSGGVCVFCTIQFICSY